MRTSTISSPSFSKTKSIVNAPSGRYVVGTVVTGGASVGFASSAGFASSTGFATSAAFASIAFAWSTLVSAVF